MKTIIQTNYQHLSDFIRNLPDVFPNEGELIYDKRNKVKRFIHKDENLIVKKFKRPHLIQRIVYTFFKRSKAERAFLYAGVFRKKGFNTPHEIAYIEIKENGLFANSYFVSTECTDAPLMPILNKEGFNKQIAHELAVFLTKLHINGILHGDLNLNNILYRIEDEQCHFTLIDTNRSKFIANPNIQICMNNLKRLTHNKGLMDYVVREYALTRQWNPEECTTLVFQYLSNFEKKVHRKRQFQSFVGIKKK